MKAAVVAIVLAIAVGIGAFLLGKRDAVEIYGSDYPTPDGTAVRDYIHVVDLADAHVRALAWASDQEGAHRLNLGTGVGSSVKEVIGLVEEVTGRPVPVRWAARRPGDAVAVWADPASARRSLGWEARYDLRTMVETARHLERLGLGRPICVGVHAVFAAGAWEALREVAARVVTCNTVLHASNAIDVSGLVAGALGELLTLGGEVRAP